MLMFKPVAGTWYCSIIEPVDSELTAHQTIADFTVVIAWYVLSMILHAKDGPQLCSHRPMENGRCISDCLANNFWWTLYTFPARKAFKISLGSPSPRRSQLASAIRHLHMATQQLPKAAMAAVASRKKWQSTEGFDGHTCCCQKWTLGIVLKMKSIVSEIRKISKIPKNRLRERSVTRCDKWQAITMLFHQLWLQRIAVFFFVGEVYIFIKFCDQPPSASCWWHHPVQRLCFVGDVIASKQRLVAARAMPLFEVFWES